MFNRKSVLTLLSLLLVAAFVLSACQPQVQEVIRTVEVVTTQEVVRTVEVVTTQEVVTTVEVIKTVEPQPTTRRGGWLDEIIVSVVGADSAVTQLQAGAIDLYGTGLASKDLPAIEAAGMIKSVEIGGTYYELTFNPYGPVFDGTGKLKPFNSAKVREAVNWLVDRDFLNQEVYAGGGLAKFFSITTNYPDYAELADVARALESKYAYNPELANEVITAEMEAMGATKTGDQWT